MALFKFELNYIYMRYRADPFAKKDWYDIQAPSVFNVRNVGKTLVTRTQGTKVCSLVLTYFLIYFLWVSNLFGL